jgi:rubrerythrin
MAHDYWQDESTRLTEKCQEVDIDRAALDEGAVLWNDVMRKVVDFEANLQQSMQRAATSGAPDFTKVLQGMESTVDFLEEKLELATERSWNLLVCAIGAELEAFRQGKEMLEDTLGVSRKGKEKVSDELVNTEDDREDEIEEASSSAIRLPLSPPKPKVAPKPTFFDTDNEDPDPELLISHQDTDDTD